MRDRLLEIMVCPKCKAPLTHSAEALQCGGCAERYKIIDGVPAMLTEVFAEDKAGKATKKMFSFAWRHFARDEVSKQWFKDSFTYMSHVPNGMLSAPGPKIGLDVGCGSGIDMMKMNDLGFEMVGIDISDAVYEASFNTVGIDKVHVVQASVYDLPFRDGLFDIGYSFGVLHHLPEPEKGFRALCDKVKSGGAVIIYVYEDFSERTFLERLLLRSVNSLRIITKRLPPLVLYILCVLFSPFVLLFCSLPYRLFSRIPTTAKLAERIPFRHTVRLDCIIADLYDRFSPPIENRYGRDDVKKWFDRAGFADFGIAYHRGWVAWGRRS